MNCAESMKFDTILQQMESMLPNGSSRPSMSWIIRVIAGLAVVSCSVSDAQLTQGNETDRDALLMFKADVIDPHGVLSSWNSTIHFCQWYGITCGRRHQRVTSLILLSHKLSGTISPHVGNLSFLQVLVLQNNSFHMTIPSEVGHLTRLRGLYLGNNSLTGTIPPSITRCSNLVNISLQFNNLHGNLPVDLGALSKLERLGLRDNLLSGVIPPSLGNLTSLEVLLAGGNLFEGTIPETMGNLINLRLLDLRGSNLAGNFPLWMTNLSSLETLDLSSNRLTGSLPRDLGISLPKISFLSLMNQQITGSIPESISNMSNLQVFQFAMNNLTGNVPSFREMSKLYIFDVGGNNLGSRKANDLSFLCSMTNSTFLWTLGLNLNNFGGSIPECIQNLSVNTFKRLYLSGNALSGFLPSGIWKLVNLQELQLHGNNFIGAISREVGNLTNLKILNLSFCKFTGPIPYTLGNLTQIIELYLSQNNLSGTIPNSLSKCQSLLLLDLADNNLTGVIPPEIMSLTSLSKAADFSGNNLEGEIPIGIGNLRNLAQLRINGNRFSGEIPSALASCMSLEALYMDENMLNGSIPTALSSLKGLQVLNLSHNHLSGQIPKFLEGLSLSELDLSFNDFEGHLPVEGVFANISATSITGNEKLCGGLPDYQLPLCKATRGSNKDRVRNVVIYTIPSVLAIIFVVSLIYFLWRRVRGKTVPSGSSDEGFTRVSYQDLLKATDGFSPANLIGTGSFGSVFQGFLALYQTAIAIKVLNLERHGATKSFIAECEALRNIRHRNLVKVLTACSGSDYQGNDFKALVYELMVNGNLDEWLHPRAEIKGEPDNRKLNLLQRVDIAVDVACALDYLHHQCETPIVHCDLKPSNVLIDGEMVAHVGDFGLVRFMPEATREMISDQTSSVGVKGSFGYIAPEYGAGVEVSVKGDVYSYGILLLEMFIGKRPTDEMFSDGLNLHSFAREAFPKRVLQIIDPVLLEESLDEDNDQYFKISKGGNERVLKIHECLVSIVEIGVLCSSDAPRDRMRMNEVVAALHTVRTKLGEVN